MDQHLADFPARGEFTDAAQVVAVTVFGVAGKPRGLDDLDNLPPVFCGHLLQFLDLAGSVLLVGGYPCQDGDRDALGFLGISHG
jgi:hypothetical protein